MDKNNLDNVIKTQSESKRDAKAKNVARKSGIPILTAAIVFVLFVLSLWVLFKHSRYSIDAIIAQDVQKLEQVFKEINKDCKIIDFEHTKNYIDFLTVKEFIGSQVGAMNITYPKKWKGPYLKQNPTVLEQQYVVLKNKKTYYIVPGDGVVLANGKTIGVDIILDGKSNINVLTQDLNALKSSHGALVAKVEIGGNYLKNASESSSVKKSLEE